MVTIQKLTHIFVVYSIQRFYTGNPIKSRNNKNSIENINIIAANFCFHLDIETLKKRSVRLSASCSISTKRCLFFDYPSDFWVFIFQRTENHIKLSLTIKKWNKWLNSIESRKDIWENQVFGIIAKLEPTKFDGATDFANTDAL